MKKEILLVAIKAERSLTWVLNSVIVLLILSLVFWIVSAVRGEDYTELVLAQCLRAECDECTKDKRESAATLHVLRKGMEQWNRNHVEQRTISDQARLYCAVFDPMSRRYYGERATNIRNSTFEKPLHGSAEWWARTRKLVRRFQDGVVDDPTPRADHFGGPMDISRAIRSGWTLVAKMSNLFWTI